MTTTLKQPETACSQMAGGGRCKGCPRCRDANAGFCKQVHPRHGNLHPICKICDHCVLRGLHDDDVNLRTGGGRPQG